MSFIEELLNSYNLALVIYAFALGWMIHSKKHDIVWFFKDHCVEIAVALIMLWPYLTIGLFWINVLIWKINMLMYPILVSMFSFILFSIWLLRSKRSDS